jgi:hypothetical protein
VIEKKARELKEVSSVLVEKFSFVVFPTLAWVKHRAELSGVPLLCKEGRRGGSLLAAFNS